MNRSLEIEHLARAHLKGPGGYQDHFRTLRTVADGGLRRGGRLFGLFKFATMLRDSPSMGTGTITLHNDPRVLPVGRFLRKTKLNELPQLLNVLRGEMSIVGPRPQTPRCFSAFPPASQQCIRQVPPGLTGVGSLVFRDEEGLMREAVDPDRFYDAVIMPYKGKLEEWYVAHAGIGTYLRIIVLTVWVMAGGSRTLLWSWLPGLPALPPELAAQGALA